MCLTADNPADCGSRGLSAGELREHELWWKGPPWLRKDPIAVPKQPHRAEFDALKGEGAKLSACLVVSTTPAIWFENKFSSYRTLLHVTAWVKRAAHNLLSCIRHHPINRAQDLSVDEVKSAEVFLLGCSQRRAFPAELKLLSSNPPKKLPSSSNLLVLHPFLGQDGLLRIGGRLSKAPISLDQKFPVIISSKDITIKFLFKYRHVSLSHCGPTLLFSTIGEEFYVTGAKQLARTVCKQCVICRKVAAKSQSQLMGQLPAARVTPSPPFTTVGIDYAGPFTLKRGYTRKPQMVKAYLAVFVCFATKAIHLEIVSDLTTEAFLAALKRFTARRGLPQDIHSDNGTNFVGAKRDLEEFYQLLSTTETSTAVHSFLLDQQIRWHNIPERAPHFGGLWEAAVKSTKHHLKRVVGDQKLNYEEMSTISTQVEACLNSRPLGAYYSHSPDEVMPLTPGHFLVGRPLKDYPETPVEEKIPLCNRWTLCQAIVQQFWKKWSREYLQQMQASRKWLSAKPNLEVGDVVLMIDGSIFQTHWSLARVVAVYHGEDGLVRAVDVELKKALPPEAAAGRKTRPDQIQVKTHRYRRPDHKLALLLPVKPDT